MVTLYTIGFTKKSASQFFGLVKQAEVVGLVDVRLNNVSQLAGFAKRDDLRFFLKEIIGVEYSHLASLAPTREMLDRFKKHGGDWETYEADFIGLMRERRIEHVIAPSVLDQTVLLCSEDKPHHCHRRLVAEYLQGHWGDVEIHHLGYR